MEVIDLHCDLLAYLALSPDRTAYEPISRCSIPQLQAGGVKTQVLAIGSTTDFYSLLLGLHEVNIYLDLSQKYPGAFLPAIENASAIALESEPLESVFNRLEGILNQIHPLYISLTWNGENRFGGGCGANCGLKDDGKEFLRFLSGRGVAVDFSHTSDSLACDLFNCIDREGLDLPVMASHSNFRSIIDIDRNLPDAIAKEIIRRKGLIGVVFYSRFLGSVEKLTEMVEYGFSLGGENLLAFGADFFCLEDISSLLQHGGGFFDEMANSSCYPCVIEQLKKSFSSEEIEKIASKNAAVFIENQIKMSS